MQQIDERSGGLRAERGARDSGVPAVVTSGRSRTVSIGFRRLRAAASECRPFALPVLVLALISFATFSETTKSMREQVYASLDSAAIAAGLRVGSIVIRGDEGVPDMDILEAIALADARPLPFYDVSAARDRLLEIPRLKNATVRKVYPGALHLTLVERQPFALWQNEQTISVIDRTGNVIRQTPSAEERALPLFVGKGANDHAEGLLSELADYPKLGLMVDTAIRVADRRWNLELSNGVSVRLPELRPHRAIAILAQMVSEARFIDQPITVIDLRLEDRITLTVDDEAAIAQTTRTRERAVQPGERQT